MSAQILDGAALARRLRGNIKDAARRLRLRPGLAVLIAGDDRASHIYVRNKARAAEEAGFFSLVRAFPADVQQKRLLDEIADLNDNPAIHGILVQLPLPPQIHAPSVINALAPDKDADGLHPLSAGALAVGEPTFVACTPQGCLRLAQSAARPLSGLNALIIGRSSLVGRPLAFLLLSQDCTVTIAHSKTRSLPDLCRRADLLIAALGRARFVKGDWVKPGAIVIDVGINPLPAAQGEKRILAGDVDFAPAAERAAFITPVPGGVGPMTIACLLRNTLLAACRRNGVPAPSV